MSGASGPSGCASGTRPLTHLVTLVNDLLLPIMGGRGLEVLHLGRFSSNHFKSSKSWSNRGLFFLSLSPLAGVVWKSPNFHLLTPFIPHPNSLVIREFKVCEKLARFRKPLGVFPGKRSTHNSAISPRPLKAHTRPRTRTHAGNLCARACGETVVLLSFPEL